MNKETGIEQFIHAIEQLPPAYEQGQWVRWLSEYHTPGYYHRQVGRKRYAKYAYAHLANPEMLLWLIQAAGVNKGLVKLAESEYESLVNVNQIAGAMREHVPWDVLESSLRQTIKETTHWLQYWKPNQIRPAITEPWILNHSGSDQLNKVKPGDVVWIISVEPSGKLITLGPIHAEKIVNQKKAEALWGTNVWPADWHVINTTDNVFQAKYTDLSPIASRLRFVSKDFPKLVLRQGKLSGTQFQQVRRLEPESAALISHKWWNTKSRAEIVAEKFRKELDELGALDEKRSIVVRREQKILREILFGSATVKQCGICGREYPVSLLVVAHIKARAHCTESERLETEHNLMPLCLLGCDSLFEKGFISVKDGYVIKGPIEANTKDLKAQITPLLGADCAYWTLESRQYFDWRAKHPIHR